MLQTQYPPECIGVVCVGCGVCMLIPHLSLTVSIPTQSACTWGNGLPGEHLDTCADKDILGANQ